MSKQNNQNEKIVNLCDSAQPPIKAQLLTPKPTKKIVPEKKPDKK